MCVPPSRRSSNIASMSASIVIVERLRVALLDAQARVAQHAVHVVVAEQHQHPDRAHVHRVLLADERVLRVRVVEEAGLEGIEHRRQVAACSGVSLVVTAVARWIGGRPGCGRTPSTVRHDRRRSVTVTGSGRGAGKVLAVSLQLVLDGRHDGGRRSDAAGRAQPRGDHRRADRLLRRRDPAAERAGGRRPGRRVGALGAQPLRRRRGAPGRGRRSGSGSGSRASPSPIDVVATGRRSGSSSSSTQRAEIFEGVTPVRRAALLVAAGLADDRRESRPPRPHAAAPDRAGRSRHRRRTRSTRSTRSRRGTRGTACARRKASQRRRVPADILTDHDPHTRYEGSA